MSSKHLFVNINNFSLHLIWIMAILELITVPLLVLFSYSGQGSFKAPWQGFIIGYVGALILFLLLNRFISYLNLTIQRNKIKKFARLPVLSIYGGLILCLLFYFQNLLALTPLNALGIFYEALSGFIATSLSIVIVGFIYQILSRYFHFMRIIIISSSFNYGLISCSILTFAILAGVYEAIALPIINLWRMFPPEQQLAIATITGLSGGIAGSLLAVLFSRFLFLCYKPSLRFAQSAGSIKIEK